MHYALNRKPQRTNGGFLQTRLASRLALAVLVLFDIVSLVYLPPDMLTDYLSTVNCEVRVKDLHWNRIFSRVHRSREVEFLVVWLELLSRVPTMGLSRPRNDQTCG